MAIFLDAKTHVYVFMVIIMWKNIKLRLVVIRQGNFALVIVFVNIEVGTMQLGLRARNRAFRRSREMRQ